MANRVLRKAQDQRLTAGKSPAASAAGAVYYACKELDKDVTEREVAEAAGTTQTTIKNHYDTRKEELEKDVLVKTTAS
jgi:transcription initiation factor TFIIB